MADIVSNERELLAIEKLDVFHGQFRAVHHVDLTVRSGEIVSLIGANGAGKSSLLKAIIGQVDRISGSIRYLDTNLVGLTTGDIVAAGVALMPEGRRLFRSLSVEENLHIGWEVGRKGEIRLKDIYDFFPPLLEKRKSKAGDLSGGQQQMVAFGRALLANPRLLLCDEISLGLAPAIVKSLYEVILSIKARGISILLVEQDVTRALAVADRYYCLLEGNITLTGRSAEASRDTIMQHYFGV